MNVTSRAALLCALVLVAAPLAACTTSASVSNCDDTSCVVSLSGAGSTTHPGDSPRVRLVTSDTESATFELESTEVSCTEDQTVQVEEQFVTCIELAADAIEIKIVDAR